MDLFDDISLEDPLIPEADLTSELVTVEMDTSTCHPRSDASSTDLSTHEMTPATVAESPLLNSDPLSSESSSTSKPNSHI